MKCMEKWKLERSKCGFHVTLILIVLHWLPNIKFRIQLKFLVTIYKALHGQAPAYIRDLLQVSEDF